MGSKIKTIILTIVRHGNTDANVNRIIHGWVDTPLNDTGVKQAKEAGKALTNVIFDHAYSSDLQRANKTCQLILEENKKSLISSEKVLASLRMQVMMLSLMPLRNMVTILLLRMVKVT